MVGATLTGTEALPFTVDEEWLITVCAMKDDFVGGNGIAGDDFMHEGRIRWVDDECN